MAVNAYLFSYNTGKYYFNAKALEDERIYKIQFLNPVDHFSLPQQFLLHTGQVMVFLTEEPNAPFYLTDEAKAFLKNFSEDLKNYMLEFA